MESPFCSPVPRRPHSLVARCWADQIIGDVAKAALGEGKVALVRGPVDLLGFDVLY